ncbi:MAG TPA: PAS domain S-box protein [Abditibacteriaceae bacterium]|nr:PAS domain S-box protein [Abditibacteriaceae bacterium]
MAAILEASNDAIYARTLDNVILSWGRCAERLYGYSGDEMIGQRVSRLLPPDHASEADEISRRIARGQHIEHLETVRVTKDGRRIDVDLNVWPTRDSTGQVTGAIVITRNITDESHAQRTVQRLEESAQNRALIMETANRVALDILASRTGVEALRHIADAARVLASARYAALGVARLDGQGLSEFITVGLTPEQEAAIGPLPRGHGILGLLLQRSEPLRLDVLADNPHSAGFPPNHPPMDSFLGVPIRRGDSVIGSLYLTNKQGGGAFTEADEVAVQALGAHAAVAIYNLQMLSRQHALLRGLMMAQEEERRAVAYDLHDGLTQYVMASHAHLESFRRAHAEGKEAKAAREVDQGLRYLKEAVVESRRLVNGLRALALDDLGLAGALEQLVNEEKTRAGWAEADLLHNISGQRFDKVLETGVYRVAQEALTNARKHAATTKVRVLLVMESKPHIGASQLRLEVQDWGRGFEADHQEIGPGHVGLHSMVERAQLLGGTFELQSTPGSGTRVHATFPVLESNPVEPQPMEPNLSNDKGEKS